jgi:PPM family protein phosphatase
LTDVGRVRSHNEDKVLFVEPTESRPDSLALVADGMGGHAAGEVASTKAAETIRRVFFDTDGPVPKVLNAAFAAANREIIAYGAEHPECAGMGTTCSVVVVRDDKAWLAHVGDSRIYLLRRGELEQLTHDQTLVAKLVDDGTLTKDQARNSAHNNIVLQALGVTAELRPEIPEKGRPLLVGDVIILCSDGLHGLVPETIIADTAGRAAPLEACHRLIEAAREAGGHDNISIGVFSVVPAAAVATKQSSKDTTRRLKPSANIFEPPQP